MEAFERVRRALSATPLVADEDEYDVFAGKPLTPPDPDEEGNDAVHAEGADGGA